MKEARALALDAERLTELAFEELGAVKGGASIRNVGCVVLSDPSDFFVSVCDGCLTRNCT